MKDKNIIRKGPLLIGLALICIGAVVYFLARHLDGQPPKLTLALSAPVLGISSTFDISIADEKNGLRRVWVAVLQEGREVVLLDRNFPSAGPFSGGQVREESVSVRFDSKAAGVKDGKAMLRVMALDYAWRNWFKGNSAYQETEILIDTLAPEIEVVSNAHYLAQGGAGLVIYRLSEQCPVSGVQVGDVFYPGYSGNFSDAGVFMAFIAVSHDQPTTTPISVTATDAAGNAGRAGLNYRINARRFKSDTLNLSEDFLRSKMPEFRDQLALEAGVTDLDIYLKVNGDLRGANDAALLKVTATSDRKLHWQGAFQRLPNAAPRAAFADRRAYLYQGRKIDQQTHLGVDLASLAHSPVPAANTGKVVFADSLGIYGKTVVLDHGFGLFSMYSHLSHIDVSMGQIAAQGDVLGKTGMTGLAGGDHLHFSILVHGTFVNPIEWWDIHWIENNIAAKISAAQPS